jgi:hypothetical protein
LLQVKSTKFTGRRAWTLQPCRLIFHLTGNPPIKTSTWSITLLMWELRSISWRDVTTSKTRLFFRQTMPPSKQVWTSCTMTLLPERFTTWSMERMLHANLSTWLPIDALAHASLLSIIR